MAEKTGYTTSSRTRIRAYLEENANRAVTVHDIARQMERAGTPVNLTTIYRYLDKLTREGTVLKYVAEKGGQTVFQFVEQGHQCQQHLHLKCVRCGAISHLDCGFMDEIVHHIQAEHGFRLQCKNSILYGLCSRCQAAGGREKQDL